MDTATTPLDSLVPPRLGPARGILAFLAAAVVVAGCRDAPTDPMVGLVAEDAYAALALGATFPDPVSWVSAEELSAASSEALERWQASWDLPAQEGREAREAVYGPLVADLAGTLEGTDLVEELARLEAAVVRAQGLGLETLPPHVAEGVHRATAQALAARAALDGGAGEATLEALIRGGDALREVGPEAVARALQSEVEERLGRVSESDPYSEQDLERLHRLVRGGRQAVEMGDWGLAIRRAFYAKGLLDGNG